MNKIKKIFISFSAFITGLLTKIPVSLAVDPKYGVTVQYKYGVFDPTMEKNISTIGEKISKIGKITIPVLLFVIGLFVILNKRITKKVKAILISIFIILAVLGSVLMNYIATNF